MQANIIDLGSDSSAGFKMGVKSYCQFEGVTHLGKLLSCLVFITFRSLLQSLLREERRSNTKYYSGKTSYMWVRGVLCQVSGTAGIMVLKNCLRKKVLNCVLGYSVEKLTLSWLW